MVRSEAKAEPRTAARKPQGETQEPAVETALQSVAKSAKNGISQMYDMLPELRRLDLLLEQAVARVPAIFGVKPGAVLLRGLHISETDAEQLFAHLPGLPVLGDGEIEYGA